jgi:DNA mismatch endonuclease, patch repair protein
VNKLWRPAPKRDYKPREAAVTSKMMAAVKSRNSKAEILLRKWLWRRGFRYRLHGDGLLGKPDLIFPSAKTAVFVDGDFWHGRSILNDGLDAFAATMRTERRDWWIAKIQANVARDEKVTATLRAQGWRVIRVWESDVLTRTDEIGSDIERILRTVRR